MFHPSLLKLTLSLCFCLFLFTSQSQAQYSKFNGTWVADSSVKPDENTSGMLYMMADTLEWNIYNNQMLFNLNYKMKGSDTLLLILKKAECSHAFRYSTIKFPAPKSIYAKCYLLPNNQMGVIYMDKAFSKSVISYVKAKMSLTDQKNLFPDILFLKNP